MLKVKVLIYRFTFCNSDFLTNFLPIIIMYLVCTNETNLHIFFLSFLSSQLIGFVILCLLKVRYRFRVQIFANTLLSVRRRSGGGTPSQNLGSPQICPRQIFAYWYSGSAFIPRFSPVLRFFRVLSMIFTTSSSVFDINVLLLCCYRLSC